MDERHQNTDKLIDKEELNTLSKLDFNNSVLSLDLKWSDKFVINNRRGNKDYFRLHLMTPLDETVIPSRTLDVEVFFKDSVSVVEGDTPNQLVPMLQGCSVPNGFDFNLTNLHSNWRIKIPGSVCRF